MYAPGTGLRIRMVAGLLFPLDAGEDRQRHHAPAQQSVRFHEASRVFFFSASVTSHRIVLTVFFKGGGLRSRQLDFPFIICTVCSVHGTELENTVCIVRHSVTRVIFLGILFPCKETVS